MADPDPAPDADLDPDALKCADCKYLPRREGGVWCLLCELELMKALIQRILTPPAEGGTVRWTRVTLEHHPDIVEMGTDLFEDAMDCLIFDDDVREDRRGTLSLGPTEARERLAWIVLRLVATPARPIRGRSLPELWSRAGLRAHPELAGVSAADLDDVLDRLRDLEFLRRGRDGKLLLVEVPELAMGMHIFVTPPRADPPDPARE